MQGYKYYERKVNYYETDKMQVVHHSNYARYLEEARIDFMSFYKIPYDWIEERGFMIPVLELHSEFKEAIRYGETVRIYMEIDKVSSARFSVKYKVYDSQMKSLKHVASSLHCFLDKDFKPVSMKKDISDIYDILMSISTQNK